jgi:translation initiation factor 1
MPEEYKLVYSDDPNRKKEKSKSAPGTGRAVLRVERKGRGGKIVTIIEQLALSAEDMRKLLKELQQLCGTGGTLKENHLELQGDCREKVRPKLQARGYKVA